MIDIQIQKRQGDFFIDFELGVSDVGITALYGPSGAGKTSIVNMVAGLIRPDAGYIIVNHRTLFDSKKGIHLPPEQRGIGYIFQDGRLFPHLSVRRNLVYGMRFTPKRERVVTFDQVVGLLGIEAILERRPAKLSGGEKQRVAIGRALLTRPQLLLMDEPLASLDVSRKAEVLPFLSTLCREFKIPTLYVSHSMDEIRRLCSHVTIIEAGKVVSISDH